MRFQISQSQMSQRVLHSQGPVVFLRRQTQPLIFYFIFRFHTFICTYDFYFYIPFFVFVFTRRVFQLELSRDGSDEADELRPAIWMVRHLMKMKNGILGWRNLCHWPRSVSSEKDPHDVESSVVVISFLFLVLVDIFSFFFFWLLSPTSANPHQPSIRLGKDLSEENRKMNWY